MKLPTTEEISSHAYLKYMEGSEECNQGIQNRIEGFKDGAEWMQKQLEPKWIDADKFDKQDGEEVLGCHFHDNWHSIIIWDKDKNGWYNQWDDECECWPSHVMKLPKKPYED